MASRFEEFWKHDGFVVIGHSARAPFPKLTFAALRAKGKRVYAVDPSSETIEGETAYHDLSAVPGLPLAAGSAGLPMNGDPLQGIEDGEAAGSGCGCGAEGEGCCGGAAAITGKRLAAAAVVEVPPDEIFDWIDKIADNGIKAVWIHMGRDTPEALALAKERGMEVCHGTCAVQYLDSGFPHCVHAWIRKALGRW